MVTELSHPLVEHWLAELRDVETPAPRFRVLLRSLSAALFLEASRDLPLAEGAVRTPLEEMPARHLAAPPVLVPILRAGLGMADAMLDLLPEARVCHLGLYRDHATLQPVTYYSPVVTGVEGSVVFLLDPMLATGGSAAAALEVVKGWGVARVKLLAVLGVPEGVRRVREAHPDVEVYLACMDRQLNEVGYILPGLGDAGDRQFGG